ncbi:unnamed protein product [Eruca vesicaria subsp. sativa]|uniref:Uncharacterized protein n=1 Tax=Eruca vesicaria subsp. sativa TaxID=29727 RepID=A0ABC8KEK2_ERUVS|nr:unnamed protein product [Eruca vesicaria subsp. sativa]
MLEMALPRRRFSSIRAVSPIRNGFAYPKNLVLLLRAGMYVANRASDKITQLTDNVYVCRSGSAADSQVVSDYVCYFLHQHAIQLGQPATVKVSAYFIRMLAYNNKKI